MSYPARLFTALLPGLWLLCLARPAAAQEPAATGKTLLERIHTARSDTGRIHALLDYSSWLIDVDKDSSVRVAEQALLLSRQEGYAFGEGRSHQLQGVAYAENGDYPRALTAYNQAIPIFKQLRAELPLGKVYNNIGNVYNNQGRLEEAAACYFNAIHFLERAEQPYAYAIYNNLAIALRKLNQHDRAIHYSRLGEAEARKAADTIRLIQLLSATSDALIQSGRIAPSLRFSREGLFLSDRVGYTVGKTVALLNLADYHAHARRYDSALHYLQDAAALARKVGDPTYVEEAHYGLAKVQFTLGRYEPARQNLLHSLAVARKLNDREHLAKTYGLLSDYFAARGQYDRSLEAFRQSKAYDDSLRSEAATRNMHALEAKYRTAQKDKEIARKQLALSRQEAELKTKNGMIILILTGLIALSAVSVLGYRSYRQKQKLQAQQILTLQKEHEAKALLALMQGEERERVRIARELHDGVGSLLSALKMYLGSLSTEHGSVSRSATYQEAVSLVGEAASEVRKTAHNLMPQVLHQQGLEEAIRYFCSKISKGQVLQVEFQGYGTAGRRFAPDFELMVYRLVQELLHNTLRHAEATQALVQLSLSGDLLAITVEDNGKGFAPEGPEQNGGMGLQSIRSRVEAFNGHLDFASEEGRGTTAYIEFYLEKIKGVCAQ
ncbi:MAG TPA: tetratricopeptide repeat protein [Chitinophagaceae bacterium]|jgi:signal transduction histidine kinase|nr:tetratricopeptide repeat protein [Chitinophagaceae bacterium]